jgi:hypothetical protein
MPYDLTVLPQARLALFRFHGMVTVAEAKAAFEDYVAHPGFDPRFVMLSDARAVTEIDATFGAIFVNVLGLGGLLRRFSDEALSVVLVEEGMVFGMVRMLEQVLDALSRIKMRIAWTVEEAATLTGRPAEALHALLAGHTPRQAKPLAAILPLP